MMIKENQLFISKTKSNGCGKEIYNKIFFKNYNLQFFTWSFNKNKCYLIKI